ncbi:piRNA biogenesis protein EXD1 [Gadus chalcogrammus]|uniref:piRNA biogenesis protein EXD1 n=1 Tax=Gadus chalcogrammus TaxID=1042646 RepID=UPI0024C256A4|nr:piRNA biogenesis protein EXD1 [Gadus chalcogrammus]
MAGGNLEFADILKRKRVKLTLKTACYFGIVQRINSNKSVTLTDVVDVKDGRKFPGVKLFFGHEIVNVEFCGETNGINGEIFIPESEGILNVEEFQPYKKNIICDNDDDADDEYVNFQVIDEFNEKFGPAVMHIKKQHVIGVAADGVESFQHGRLCWLQIATKNRVYLFDILLLGAQAFKNGLSMILQSQRMLKVVHDCRGVASSLLAQFGVKLTNVFDTQVADVMCFLSDTGGYLPDRVSTLQEVVSTYLKVPSSGLSSLRMKTMLSKEEREMWYARPCPLPLLKVMALGVIHLQPLRLVLLDAMMTEYLDRVDSYLSNSLTEPGAVGHITMSNVLELPRELRELEHLRKDRKRHALDHLYLNQHGLLDRFNPRANHPPEATPQSKTPPITTPQTLPIAKSPYQTPPITTPQIPPITTPPYQSPPISQPQTTPTTTPQTLPITTPPYRTPPTTTPQTLPITTPRTLPKTRPLFQTPPIATPLIQTPPTIAPLFPSTPITKPLSQAPTISAPLFKTAMPRIQAEAPNNVPRLEPPPIEQAFSFLQMEAPASRPQLTRGSSLQSTALITAGLAASPPPAVLGPAPPPAVLGPAPPPTVLGLAPPLAVAPRPSLSPSNPGMRELMLGRIGRGRPLSEAPQAPPFALPSFGRGLLLQKAPVSSPVPQDWHLPWASMDNQMSPSAMPCLVRDTAGPQDLRAARDLQGVVPGLGRGQFKVSISPFSPTLGQSFASFRR